MRFITSYISSGGKSTGLGNQDVGGLAILELSISYIDSHSITQPQGY